MSIICSEVLVRKPKSVLQSFFAALWLGCLAASAGAESNEVLALPETAGISLRDYVRRVLDHNETIQGSALEYQISRKRHEAEQGIFEPEAFVSGERIERERQNTFEQQSSQSGDLFFREKNNLYSTGLEALAPSGARVRLGYNLRDISNNTRPHVFAPAVGMRRQYESSIALVVAQPLLKNAGLAATMANIRLAAAASEVAFQEYRKHLMQTVAAAEAAYWDLYLMQEQYRFAEESSALAATLLRDNRERVRVGRAPELEELQAEAGLALRHSRQGEALQKRIEAANRLATLTSDPGVEGRIVLEAVDEPQLRPVELAYVNSINTAVSLNADYLGQQKQIESQEIRLAYARNQRWPQLDLKASYGLNGLGETFEDSLEVLERAEFANWSVGLEFRIPLGGGIKARKEHEAARLRVRQSILSMKDMEAQISNALDSAIRKVRSAAENVRSYQSVVDFTQTLLESQLGRLDVGRIDSRTVLETEEKLFEAKVAVIESLVQFQRALLELELIEGSTLRARELEVSQRELKQRTDWLVGTRNISHSDYLDLRHRVQENYRLHSDPQFYRLRDEMRRLDDPPADPLREEMRRKMLELDGVLVPEAPAPDPKDIDALRRRMRELD